MTRGAEGRIWLGVMGLVAIGGGIGALARHLFHQFALGWGVLPWASTAVVNTIGGLAIGFLFVHFETRFRRDAPSRLSSTGLGQRLVGRGHCIGTDPTLPPVEIFRHNVRLRSLSGLLITGVLGSFTTFSTYALDIVRLMERGERQELWAVLLVTTGLPVAAAALGLWFGERSVGSVTPPVDVP